MGHGHAAWGLGLLGHACMLTASGTLRLEVLLLHLYQTSVRRVGSLVCGDVLGPLPASIRPFVVLSECRHGSDASPALLSCWSCI